MPGCFTRQHPCEATRRRLFVKTALRKVRCLELLDKPEEALACLEASVLLAEPKNPDGIALKAKLASSREGSRSEEDVGGREKICAPVPFRSRWSCLLRLLTKGLSPFVSSRSKLLNSEIVFCGAILTRSCTRSFPGFLCVCNMMCLYLVKNPRC